MGPRWSKMAQDGPNMAHAGPKMPKTAPRWPRIAPKMTQDGPRVAQDGSRMVPRWSQDRPGQPRDGPRWPQDGPRWPKMAPRRPLIELLGCFAGIIAYVGPSSSKEVPKGKQHQPKIAGKIIKKQVQPRNLIYSTDNQIDCKANKLVLKMPKMLLSLAAQEQKR